MPSSFPGVDPYLESRGRWPDFHARFLIYCCDVLADRLPDHYVAQIDERICLVEPSADAVKLIRPDLMIERHGPSGQTRPASAGALTLEPVTIPFLDLEEVRETRIEILHLPDRALVTVLEMLSPSNKTEPGFGDYRSNRIKLQGQPINLIELDLLIRGHRLPMRRPLPPADYYALVGRADRRPDCDVYAWTVRQPLPAIPVPLKAPDPDIPLDLADLYTVAYDRGRYARLIDYGQPLTVPLAPEDRAWAEERARTARR